MAELRPELVELAETFGVSTEFWDWQGVRTQASDATLTAVLGALEIDASTPESAAAALAAHRHAKWQRMLPSVVVVRGGQTCPVWVHVGHGNAVDLWIDLEGGGTRTGLAQLENWELPHEVDGRLIGEASFEIPADLALGYHTIRARERQITETGEERIVDGITTLIVTPPWLGVSQRLGERRAWGLAAQLYSVRSQESWGVGDLIDLQDLAVWAAAEHGAGFVLINPLHAAEPTTPMEPSPYLPTTRRFANPLYLRVERIPEFGQLPGKKRKAIRKQHTAFAAAAAVADATDRIDRDTAWDAKVEALRTVFGHGRSAGRELAFRAYVRREGHGLQDYATWCALADEFGLDWREWPERLQHPSSVEVGGFRNEHAVEVDFYCWLQWVLDEQLAQAQSAALRAGMSLGVMHDLAVGVHPHGADSWALQDVLATGMNVGAPPDPYNQIGQNWSQPPWRPTALEDLAYAPYRSLVSTVLRHAGGIRVDHIIGLFRLWWIPDGRPPTEGTYVRYDHEALVGILALEAHRAGAVLVGEDLGVVEPWVRDYLRERGVLGTSILWFEYEPDGHPLRPENWREYCLASVTTHDLPPTAGYLAGEHVRLRDSLGLLTRSLDEELAADSVERNAWIRDLVERGAIAEDAGEEEIIAALHRFLTWTQSRLLTVALTDAVGDRRTQNQPGTANEYPNWRIPLAGPDGVPMSLEQVLASPRAARLLREMSRL